jgi:ribulose 1,5-bisphosphate carboxylase large subunit-like protein
LCAFRNNWIAGKRLTKDDEKVRGKVYKEWMAKTKKVMTSESIDKAACHSDYVDANVARELQAKTGGLVELTIP